VLYTNRGISIGGLPSAEQDADAAQALLAADYETADAAETAGTGAGAVVADTGAALQKANTNMTITGTDILFASPENSVKSSRMTPPQFVDEQATGGGNSDQGADSGNGGARGNKLRVTGGVLAIGGGCTLTVSQDSSGAGTVDLNPRSLLVDGGNLFLTNCDKGSITVTSDIHVRSGGRLVIGDGVRINGNIYAYGGGIVEVAGSFELQGQRVNFDGQEIPGGIYIFADNSYDSNGVSVGAGYFYARRLYMIDGFDGSNYLVHYKVVNYLSRASIPGYPLMYSEYASLDSASSNYISQRFGAVKDDSAPDVYLRFSEDMSNIESFSSR
jgi:hypothetical protein